MNWAVVEIVANSIVAAAYFGITAAIAIPLIQSGQIRRNRLGAATAAIFFTCAVGHGLHGLHVLESDQSGGQLWHIAAWDAVTAVMATFYWTLRRTYSPLMRGASLFEDLLEQQRVERLEAAEAVAAARLEAERERHAQAALLRAVIDNAQPLIYVKDLEGRYLLANEAFRQSFGLGEEQLAGLTDAEIAPAEAPVRRSHDLAAVSGSFRVEERMQTLSGVRIFDSARFPVVDAEGAVRCTGGVSLDVTAEREAAAELAAARDEALAATAAKSAFLATMSHEIRTPMYAVIGMTSLLLDTPLSEQQKDMVQTARSSGDALLDLINDILDFSKIEAGELRIEAHPFDVLDAVDTVLDLVGATAADKGLEITARAELSCPRRVVGDVTRLRQVLLNLVSNAVKFTDSGAVSVRLWAEPESPESLRLWAEVTDTGIGIPPEAVDRLFSAFSQVDDSTTRKYGGTGLGLAISRRLVEAMHGEISVRSEPGAGSCFTFSVVVAPAGSEDEPSPAPARTSTALRATEERPSVAVPPQRSGSVAPLRILLAEDNPVNQKVGRLLLRNLGYWDIDVVADGQEAVAAARNRAYDVILMDIQMPVVDGLEATRRIRALPTARRPRIVALTAAAQASDREACAEAGMDDYLTKPLREGALRGLLSEVAAEVPSSPDDPGGPVHALDTLAEQVGTTVTIQLVTEFLDRAAAGVTALVTALADHAHDEVARVAHDLRSTAALFGAVGLAQLLAETETAARAGSPIRSAAAALRAEFARAESDLRAWMARHRPGSELEPGTRPAT